jgi:hypothetical protein
MILFENECLFNSTMVTTELFCSRHSFRQEAWDVMNLRWNCLGSHD